MTLQLSLTRLPHLNDTIVIKQSGGHYFISAPDSIVIDKEGLMTLMVELGKVGYLSQADFVAMWVRAYPTPDKEEEENEDEENLGDISIG